MYTCTHTLFHTNMASVVLQKDKDAKLHKDDKKQIIIQIHCNLFLHFLFLFFKGFQSFNFSH